MQSHAVLVRIYLFCEVCESYPVTSFANQYLTYSYLKIGSLKLLRYFPAC